MSNCRKFLEIVNCKEDATEEQKQVKEKQKRVEVEKRQEKRR
jgi:hypothetical protein